MKIKAKITIFTSTFLAVMVLLLTIVSVYNIKSQGEKRVENFKQEAVKDVKNNLKNLVDVAYTTIDKSYNNLSDLNYLSQFYHRELNDVIDTAESIIQRYQTQVARNQMTESEAKRKAMEEIRVLRFDGGTGYIWINDTTRPYPKMVMHPIIPSLEGKVLDDPKYNNAQRVGKNLFVAFLDVTSQQSTDGYVYYLWPKPIVDKKQKKTKITNVRVPKLSYVRRYQEWDWIVGTGIYIDDAREDIETNIKESIKAMRYDEGTGYFWINDNTLPYPTMVMHPTVPSLDGQVLDDPRYNNALGNDQNLFTAFAEITINNGEGFVDYLWPKPTPNGLTARTEKISYVKLHSQLGWIIGSGAYTDSIDAIVAQEKVKIDKQIATLILINIVVSLIFIAFAIYASYVFSDNLAKPIQSLTQIAEKISKGKDLDVEINETNREDEIGELAKSVDRLKTSTRIMISRMKKKS